MVRSAAFKTTGKNYMVCAKAQNCDELLLQAIGMQREEFLLEILDEAFSSIETTGAPRTTMKAKQKLPPVSHTGIRRAR
jgi:hypothetical protein